MFVSPGLVFKAKGKKGRMHSPDTDNPECLQCQAEKAELKEKVEVLREELSASQSELRKLEAEVQTRNAVVKVERDEAASNLHQLRLRLSAQEAERAKLSAQVVQAASLAKQHSETEATLSQSQTALQCALKEKIELKSMFDALSKDFGAKESELHKLETELRAQEAERAKLSAQVVQAASLAKQHSETEATLSQSQTALQCALKEKIELKSMFDALSKDFGAKESELHKLETELRAQEAERAKLSAQVVQAASLAKQHSETEATLSQSQMALQCALKEKIELKSMFDALSKDFGAKESELHKLETELRAQEAERAKLSAQVVQAASLAKQHSETEATLSQSQTALQCALKEKIELKSMFDALSKDFGAKESELHKLETELRAQEAERAKLSAQVVQAASLAKQHSETEATLSQSQTALQCALKEKIELKSMFDALSKDFGAKESELHKLETELRAQEAERAKLSAQVVQAASLAKQHSETEATLSQSQTALQCALKEKIELKSMFDALSKDFGAKESELHKLETELRAQEAECAKLSAQVVQAASLAKQHSETEATLSQSQTALQCALKEKIELKSMFDALSKDFGAKESELHKLETELRAQEAECAKLSAQVVQAASLAKQHSETEATLSQSQTALQCALKEKIELKSMFDALSKDFGAKESELHKLETELRAQEAECAKLSAQVVQAASLAKQHSETEATLSQSQTALQCALKEKIELKSMFDALSKDVCVKESEFRELETELRAREAECAKLSAQVVQQVASLNEAKKTLEEKEAKLTQVDVELSETKATLSQSQTELQCALKENVKLKSRYATLVEDFDAKQSDLRKLVDMTVHCSVASMPSRCDDGHMTPLQRCARLPVDPPSNNVSPSYNNPKHATSSRHWSEEPSLLHSAPVESSSRSPSNSSQPLRAGEPAMPVFEVSSAHVSPPRPMSHQMRRAFLPTNVFSSGDGAEIGQVGSLPR